MALLTGNVGRRNVFCCLLFTLRRTLIANSQRLDIGFQISCVIKEKVGVRLFGTEAGTFWMGFEHPLDTI